MAMLMRRIFEVPKIGLRFLSRPALPPNYMIWNRLLRQTTSKCYGPQQDYVTISTHISDKQTPTNKTVLTTPHKSVLEATDSETEHIFKQDLLVYEHFISEEEEISLFDEVERRLKRSRYEYDHWDDAIHGYREQEVRHWNDVNSVVIQRVKDVAFEAGTAFLAHSHVLDLNDVGFIKPHVDSVKFCGSTIAGICLLSPSIMRFVSEKEPSKGADVLLQRRCLYIMKGTVRYEYTHEILKKELSLFRGELIPRGRRISLLIRNMPKAMYSQHH